MSLRKLYQFLAAGAFILGASITAKAQNQVTQSVTLNVVLQDITSLTIGGTFNTATLTYATASDYASGVDLTQAAAMTAISNQPYSITVYASGNLINGGNSIPAGDVSILPTASTANANVTCTRQNIPVSSGSAAQIVHSTAGTASQNYDLLYSTKNNVTQADFLGKPHGTYTTTLTYTITNP